MRLLDAARTCVRGLFHRGRIERELDAELTFHLGQLISENLAAGMRPDEARRAALRSLGRPDHVKDVYRDMQRLPVVETIWRDVRYAVRGLSRAPVFSLVAVVTLALGIGANTFIFSVLHGAVLRTVPYPDADRLMLLQITATFPGGGSGTSPWSYPKFEDLRAYSTAFPAIEGFVPRDVNLAGGDDEAERVKAEIVSGGYFSLLGVPAVMGRTIDPADDDRSNPRAVAVISERLWRRMFAGDPGIIGRSVHLNRELVTIVGISPADFRGESGSAELWVPIVALAPALMDSPRRLELRNANWLTVVAKRKPDVTPAQAGADVERVVRRIEEVSPSSAFPGRPTPTWGGVATPLAEAKVDPMLRRSLLMLLGAVGFVLLITCINLASLTLSRALARQREIAVRLAIGASRAALVRQVLTETVLLGLAGGLLGILVAAFGVEALAVLRFDGQLGSGAPFVRRLSIESINLQHPAIWAFTLALAVVTGLLFGALPAARTTKLNLAHVMKSADAGSIAVARSLGRLNVRTALLVVQISLAIVLLVGAGLMLRSLSRVLTIQLGFEPGHVLTLRIDPPRAHYDDERRLILLESIADRIRALPGVDAVAVAGTVPLRAQSATSFRINGIQQAGEVGVHAVGPEYFGALRIPLTRGRLLTDDDSLSAPHVALINETFARRRWRGEDPIGQHLSLGLPGFDHPGQEATIVGIVGDVKYRSIDTPVGFDVYLPFPQQPPIATSFVVRTSSDPTSLVPAIRWQLAHVDPTLPAFDVTLMTDVVLDATARWRFSGVLLTTFAGLAVILTAAGIYGMLAYSVAARTREIGIRMALGAERAKVVKSVFLDACTICAAGLAIGLPMAAVLARFMRGLLYGVQPADPGILASVAVGVLLTAVVAATLPAWRAARIDPASALRYE